jgi:pimeloyl-ACP methyl ester carboxylesterase
MGQSPRRIAGSGEPLVLLHGIGHSRHGWWPVLDALESRHQVLSLDLPGFGDAPPLPDGVAPAVPAMADAVEREMDAAGFRTAHLAGNSMGGWIALELARRGRARTAVAISPAGGGTRRERAYARTLLKAIHVIARLGSPLAELAALPGPTRIPLYGVFFARPTRLSRDAAAHHLRTFGGAPAFAATCDRLFAERAPGLEGIRCPVTIAWGTRDFVLFPRQARYFTSRLPDVRLVTLDRLGHVPMSDDPGRVSAAILERTSGPA